MVKHSRMISSLTIFFSFNYKHLCSTSISDFAVFAYFTKAALRTIEWLCDDAATQWFDSLDSATVFLSPVHRSYVKFQSRNH